MFSNRIGGPAWRITLPSFNSLMTDLAGTTSLMTGWLATTLAITERLASSISISRQLLRKFRTFISSTLPPAGGAQSYWTTSHPKASMTSAKLLRPTLMTLGFCDRSSRSFSDASVFWIRAVVLGRISFTGSSKSRPMARIAVCTASLLFSHTMTPASFSVSTALS